MNVLIADDDLSTLKLLEKHLVKWGYDVTLAANGMEALDVVAETRVNMIVSDWMMPGMTGLELCDRIRSLKLANYVYIIIISAEKDTGQIKRSLNGRVDDFVSKPLNFEELQARMAIGARIISLESELNQKLSASQRTYRQTNHLLTHFLQIYDANLGEHCRRVGLLALEMAKRHPHIPPDTLPIVEAAGFLHDIGLVGLPKSLLSKQRTELNGEESDLFRSHPVRGEQLLSQIDLLAPIAPIVRSHHEQFNGRGFPDGLNGEQIPDACAIVSAANIYDNLIYRRKIDLKAMPEYLQQFRGYQLSVGMVELLLDVNLARINDENSRTDRLVPLNDLSEGMVLGRDLLMKSGAFIMAGGTSLDLRTIEKLKRYQTMGNIIDKVFIKK